MADKMYDSGDVTLATQMTKLAAKQESQDAQMLLMSQGIRDLTRITARLENVLERLLGSIEGIPGETKQLQQELATTRANQKIILSGLGTAWAAIAGLLVKLLWFSSQ